MFYIKTETVDQLCVPFGLIIGPCTVLSNIAKLTGDITKIIFNGFLNPNYQPSQAYNNFKAADLAWEQNISSRYKPQVSRDGYIQITYDAFTNPDYNETINRARGSQTFLNWSNSYRSLSSADKRQISFEQAKKDFYQHLSFVGVGIIRTIPLLGGVSRCIYNVNRLN